MSKIAIFHPNLDGGGAERVLVNLICGLVEQGIEVDLVLVQAKGTFLSLLPPEVRVVDLGVRRLLIGIPGLIRYLKQEQPTSLLTAFEDTNLIALWSRRLAGVSTRIIVSIHNTLSRESRISDEGLKRRIGPYLSRWFYREADAIITVSQGVADDLVRMGFSPKKMQVIYNPVVTPKFFKKLTEPIENPLFKPGSPPVILGVGRLQKQKDFTTLVRSFAQVQQQRSVRLMILGEGEERPHLEALIKELGIEEHVALPGFVTNPYAYMNKAAVFVLSSLFEGLPTVLIEAMAAGTRLVSTDCESGPREILANGLYGKLVPVGNVQSLAEAIITTLDDPPHDVETMLERVDQFSLKQAVEKYRQVLQVG